MKQTTKVKVLDVLVVDGNELTRAGIRHVLDGQPDLRVVGEAATADDAIARLRSYEPGIVLLDSQLPDGSGIEVCEAVRDLELETGILVLATDPNEESVRRFVQSGASGYLLKSASGAELRAAILDVAAGRMTFSSAVAQSVRALMSSVVRHNSSARADKSRLTQRESEVLAQLEFGLRNREIATTLGISKKTVETHVRNVLLKLGVSTRTQAVARALSA